MTKARDLSQVPNASFGFKNRIINGAMMIDQRNAGASVTPTNGAYTLDRWAAYAAGSAIGKFTVQQSSTVPEGFSNSLKVTSTSAYSISSGDITAIFQVIEGYNVSDLSWGTANAKTITLSFKVYSSLTGTFGGCLKNNAGNRSYPFSYSIPVANTWTQISLTIAGDTTGTWLTTNSGGIFVQFGLGVGSTYSATAGSWTAGDFYSATGATSVVGTNGATFYITGVQLEKGSTATSFDYRPYGTELALCQRYYEVCQCYSSSRSADNYATASAYFKVTKRANPTVTNTSSYGGTATASYFGLDSWGWYQLLTTSTATVVTVYASSEL